ncbi:hypothetical protein [Dysgonomonas sp. ZJ279]|uniref:hypothetical protein n=1 Tax=Dysgonomonas sp. ZJ279 TaxID=2709796 RepID=UPI0013EE3C21|nr:hypothetical protein [Dysgonomonas sp. ZJ279]
MNDKKQKRTFQFVKYHTCLAYIFKPAEIVFIMRMIEVEFMKLNGFYINWTRAEYMKRTGLKVYTFDKCIKKLSEMKLLTKANNELGNEVYYSFDMKLYNKLLEILHATRDVDKLIDFCYTNFEEQSRSIDSISREEIDMLKTYTKNRIIQSFKH